MRKSFLIFTILFFGGFTHSTAQIQADMEIKKKVSHVVGNHSEGNVLQSGNYYKVDNRYLEHGIWKLYDFNTLELITKAKYDKGEQIWIETKIDGKLIRVTKEEKEVIALKARIAELEKQLAESDF
jgi:hypothetical protein